MSKIWRLLFGQKKAVGSHAAPKEALSEAEAINNVSRDPEGGASFKDREFNLSDPDDVAIQTAWTAFTDYQVCRR